MSESTIESTDQPQPGPQADVSVRLGARTKAVAWLPAIVAALFFVAFSAIVLSQPEKMIEPDPYAYRASIAALENGNINLSQEQYDALSLELQQTSLGGGIMQWHQNDDGSWVSEKNPGYPFLAVGFDEAGALRLAPLFYGALACLAMWFGARRWLGRWGGTFAVGAYCSTALAMVMAWRSTMPTFTDASLIAAGLGLLIWSVVALDRSRRIRTIVGALAFFSFGLAVSVRYTSAAVLGVAAVFALIVCLRSKWKLGWSTLVWWAIASLPPLIASLAYNAVYFDGPFSTGYNASTVQFSTSAISPNLRIMPGRLWQAMPVFVIGLAAVAVLIAVQIIHAVRTRSKNTSSQDAALAENQTEFAESAEVSQPIDPSPATIDRWIGSFLVVTWAATWVMYSAYEWTANLGGGFGGGRAGGAPRFGGGVGPAMGAMSQPVYSTVRFYLPALGAIALLVAWLFTRMPAVIGILALVALFAVGGHEFINTVNSSWASMSIGGGGGSMFGPGANGGPGNQGGSGGFPQFDPSKCPNLPQLPQLPQGGPSQGGGAPSGQRPQAGNDFGTPPNGQQGRGGITFDENGCPVLPGSTSSGSSNSTTTSSISPASAGASA